MGLDLFWEGLLADDGVSRRLLSGDEELKQLSIQPCLCLMFLLFYILQYFIVRVQTNNWIYLNGSKYGKYFL